ncbi:MAG: coenzyme F420-0:L-glutamate ligase [Candidatus Dojkabacteria bacterium]|nr:coenzyme F420-0:L-glutamate ligase [Candidatus Dojkabacteria bacterium]
MERKLGIQKEANPNRELTVEFNSKRYSRYPVEMPFINIGDDLVAVIEKNVKEDLEKEDILCISAKAISIANNFVVHESKVEASWLAKLIVKFVKKWPNDPGYANPRKMQVAINEAGYLRIILALGVGTF